MKKELRMKKLILLFITVCFLAHFFRASEAQAQPLDTLKIQAEVDNLIAMGDSLRINWQSDAALEVYIEALELSQKAGLETRFGKIYNNSYYDDTALNDEEVLIKNSHHHEPTHSRDIEYRLGKH